MTGIYGHPHERALSLSVFFGTVGTVSPAFIPRPKTKPRTVVGPGRNLSSYRFNYQHTKIGSQRYLRSLPALRLAVNFPTKAMDSAVDLTGLEPAPVAGQANLRPLHHGPGKPVRAPRTEQSRPSHSSRASSNSGITLAPRNTRLNPPLTCPVQRDIIFQAYISSLTIKQCRSLPRTDAALAGFSSAKSLFRNILRVSPYSSKILRVVWL